MVALQNTLDAVLKKLAKESHARPTRAFGRRLAKVLQWGKGGARTESIQDTGLSCDLSKAFIGEEPAAIFAGHARQTAGDLVRQVAWYAYHTSIQWCVLTNLLETLVINSHWIKDGDWFSLPPIKFAEIAQYPQLFHALTPDGLLQGRIDRLASQQTSPQETLVPVDDALVETLDRWRDEAFRRAKNSSGIDEKLQTLFAQLFVIRAVEDRGLARSVPSLELAAPKLGELDVAALRKTLTRAQEKIGSELFEKDVSSDLPPSVIAGIIRDLYTPRNVPFQGVKYNFRWITSDVLGRAYEKYLANVLVPARVPPQLELWDQPIRDVNRISRRKSAGVYYTPEYIVDFLTEKTLNAYFEKSGCDAIKMPKIADLACGSGSFLTAAADSLIRRLRVFDPKRNWGKELINKQCLVGVDIDERAVTLARLSLWLRLAEEPGALPLPKLERAVFCADSLRQEIWKSLPAKFDIVLGNPPFIATGKMPSRSELEARFRSARGRFDYSSLFVELSLSHLKTNGLLGLVVPNRLFRNQDASTIRENLTEDADLLTVVDFGSNEVFADTSAYVGLLIARKGHAKPMSTEARFIKVKAIPSRFGAAVLSAADQSPREVSNKFVSGFQFRKPTGPHPWLFLSKSSLGARVFLEDRSEFLETLATVPQGIKTGANDFFILQGESFSRGSLSSVVNGLGESFVIEPTFLRPVVFGSDIKRYDRIAACRWILYPYREGHVVKESLLRAEAPKTFEYLMHYKEFLGARTSIKSSGLDWYELVRSRDETWLKSPKLVIRDLATEPSFAIDSSGQTFLVGGTAVVPAKPSDLEILLGYLNSRVTRWYLRVISPSFRAEFQKFEPQHIQRLPIPRILLDDDEVRETLNQKVKDVLAACARGDGGSQRSSEEKIDDYLIRVLGLDKQEVG